MNKEDLIKKWLDHNLNTEEQIAFEQLEEYDELIKMNSTLKGFKAPDFPIDETFTTLKPKLKPETKTAKHWLKPLLKIAAVLAIGLSVYYYSTTIETEIDTAIAQQTTIELPDASTVNLNANSSLSYNKNHWNKNRAVKLNGEAFFKVAKGQVFDVITNDGIVSVLGTEFNVKQRESYFEVTCFEGLVAVTYNKRTLQLKPGHTFRITDGKQFVNEKDNTVEPDWIRGESNFNSVPLKYVFAEFKNQYNLKVNTDQIDNSRLFTGSFTHKDLDLALQSITIPLNLNYSKSEKSIIIKRE